MIGTALPADRVNNLELQVSGLLTRVASLEAADLALDTRLDTLEADWVAYTVVLTGAVGSAVGRYKQLGNTTIHFTIEFTASAAGAGSFEFSLPVNAARAQFHPFGTCLTQDVSAGGFFFGTTYRGTTAGRVQIASGNGAVSAAFPFAWASGDTAQIEGTYEAA